MGYDHGWEAAQDTVIATLPIGHADGIGRQFGNPQSQSAPPPEVGFPS